MRPIFADLVAEIQRSIGFYASVHRDSRITKVVALGGTFRLPGLQKYLQQNLQLEVQKIDRLGNAAADRREGGDGPEREPALLGQRLRAGAAGDRARRRSSSSLLPQAIRREREWQGKTKWFAAAAACFVAGTLLPVARYYYEEAQFDKPEASEAREAIASADWRRSTGR